MRNLTLFLLMSLLFSSCIMICVFWGCNGKKNEDSICLIRLSPNSVYDPIEEKDWFLTQYVEYKFNNKDSILIGISTEYFYNNMDTYDFEKPFHFGLDKFYTYKISKDFSKLMTKILNSKYEESYREKLGETAIDDRPAEFFVINRNGKQKFISYSERHLLPEELKKIDSIIENQIDSPVQEIDKPNYSRQIILNLQDILRRSLIEPPPLPSDTTVMFTPPINNE